MSRRTTRTTSKKLRCAPASSVGHYRSLSAIVRAYQREWRPLATEELASFRGEPTLRSAIKRASQAQRLDGKRYDHQRRLSADTLKEVHRKLSQVDLSRYRDFDQLHDLLGGLLGSVPGVGELMIYDTSLRIGARLGVKPARVYLHRGTREGAKALGLKWRARQIEVPAFPRELRVLEPHEIEDCLCIFKEELGGQVARSRTLG